MDVTAELRDVVVINDFAHGKIYGDTRNRWEDGTEVRTSRIKDTINLRDGIVYITLNSSYFVRNEELT